MTELPDPDMIAEPRPTGVLTGCDGADGVGSVVRRNESGRRWGVVPPRVSATSVTPSHPVRRRKKKAGKARRTGAEGV